MKVLPPNLIDPFSPKGRRRWTESEKLAIVQQARAPGACVSAVARKHGLTPSQLFNWRKQFSGVKTSRTTNDAKHSIWAKMEALTKKEDLLDRQIEITTADFVEANETDDRLAYSRMCAFIGLLKVGNELTRLRIHLNDSYFKIMQLERANRDDAELKETADEMRRFLKKRRSPKFRSSM